MNIFTKQRTVLVSYLFGHAAYGNITFSFYGRLDQKALTDFQERIAATDGVKETVTIKTPVVITNIVILES
jgi:hypothetical protein